MKEMSSCILLLLTSGFFHLSAMSHPYGYYSWGGGGGGSTAAGSLANDDDSRSPLPAYSYGQDDQSSSGADVVPYEILDFQLIDEPVLATGGGGTGRGGDNDDVTTAVKYDVDAGARGNKDDNKIHMLEQMLHDSFDRAYKYDIVESDESSSGVTADGRRAEEAAPVDVDENDNLQYGMVRYDDDNEQTPQVPQVVVSPVDVVESMLETDKDESDRLTGTIYNNIGSQMTDQRLSGRWKNVGRQRGSQRRMRNQFVRQLPLLSRAVRELEDGMEEADYAQFAKEREPSCRELRKMWRIARRMHNKAIQTNRIPRQTLPSLFSSVEGERFRANRRLRNWRRNNKKTLRSNFNNRNSRLNRILNGDRNRGGATRSFYNANRQHSDSNNREFNHVVDTEDLNMANVVAPARQNEVVDNGDDDDSEKDGYVYGVVRFSPDSATVKADPVSEVYHRLQEDRDPSYTRPAAVDRDSAEPVYATNIRYRPSDDDDESVSYFDNMHNQLRNSKGLGDRLTKFEAENLEDENGIDTSEDRGPWGQISYFAPPEKPKTNSALDILRNRLKQEDSQRESRLNYRDDKSSPITANLLQGNKALRRKQNRQRKIAELESDIRDRILGINNPEKKKTRQRTHQQWKSDYYNNIFLKGGK